MGWKIWLGGFLSLAIIFLSLLSLLWTPHDITVIDIDARLLSPRLGHILGTDHFGRDILSMLMVGGLHSMLVAFLSLLPALAIGLSAGLLSARFYGRAGASFILKFGDMIFAFPVFLTAAILAALWGPSLWVAIFAIGLFNIPVFLRLSRSLAATLYGQPFIMAARAQGVNEIRLMRRYLLPNMADPLIMQAMIQLSLAILIEAGLGYLGFSAPPDQPGWGKMLFEARNFAFLSAHTALYPGLAIMLVVIGFNLLGEAFRDRLDRESQGSKIQDKGVLSGEGFEIKSVKRP